MSTTDIDATEAFVDRLLDATRGAFEVFTVYLGDRLGFYEALADGEWVTSADLAGRTDCDERYVREWLEQQTVTGFLEVREEDAAPADRAFRLPAAHVEALVDPDSPNYVVPLFQVFAGAVRPLDAVVDAYRTGAGVPYEAYGPDLREGQSRVNRPAFRADLSEEWLPTMPDVEARLRAGGAHVADIGCGGGWACIGLAEHYPEVRVDGYDLDRASVALARENVADAGLDDRVSIHERDASDPSLAGEYDLVTAFECVHDMSDPVGALRTMRRLAGPDGAVLVVDERVGETFTAEGTDVEWMMYGWSVLHCLPVGRAEHPSAATGTVMRPSTLQAYAEAAGFAAVEILPIENYFFRFYRLIPPVEREDEGDARATDIEVEER